MSRWLNKVNNLLEKLDGQVETVAEDGVPNVVHTVSSRAKQFLTNNQIESDESYQHVSDEMEQVSSADSSAEEDIDEEHSEEEEEAKDMMSSPSVVRPPPPRVASSRTNSDDHLPSMSTITNEVATEEEAETSQETSEEHDSAEETIPAKTAPSAVATTSFSAQERQQINKKWLRKLEAMKAQHEAEVKSLQQNKSKLEHELRSTKKELSAVSNELDQAADIVKQERKAASEERDELLAEQEEDLQIVKDEYEEKLRDLRGEVKEQAALYEEKLASQEASFHHEGGNLAMDLTKLRDREKAAQNEAQELKRRVLEFEETQMHLEQELESEKLKVHAAEERAIAAEKASAVVEERLDVMQFSHQKQLQQRQLREAELEKSLADLTQKVAAVKPSPVVVEKSLENDDYKEKYQISAEELVTVQTEAEAWKQKCEKLQNELAGLSEEHAAYYQSSQEQLRGYEQQIQDILTNNSASLPESGSQEQVQQLSLELEKTKQEVDSLSDQLVRQKGATETTKSEVLVLKGRLQIATSRAETAERAQHNSSATDLEVGPTTRRRRVKGGRTRFGQLPTRSIRNSVGLRSGTSRFKQQLGDSLDALDNWLLETGHIMRHEPLARLGLAMYMAVLHLWCFGLIAYHTVQSERTNFSELGDRSRIPHIHHGPGGLESPH